jgi:hypothetical protein
MLQIKTNGLRSKQLRNLEGPSLTSFFPEVLLFLQQGISEVALANAQEALSG